MKITAVRARRLQSATRGYNHRAIELEAQVGPDESALEVLTELERHIDERLGLHEREEALEDRINELNNRLALLERERASRQSQVDYINVRLGRDARILDLAIKAGLVMKDLDEEIPF